MISAPEWREVALGEVCEAPQYGWTTRARSAADGDSLRLLRTTDISRGQVDWSTVPFCETEPKDPQKYVLHDGDLVISRAGSIGFSFLVQDPPPAVFASYLIRFRPGPAVVPRYLAWFMRSPGYWRQVSASASGIAQQNINAKKLQSIRLPLPPLEIQTVIVAALEEQFSRLDEALRALGSARRRLKQYRLAAIAAVIGTEVTLPLLHPDWPWTTLGEMAEIVGGVTKDKKRETVPHLIEVPYLRVANVQRGRLDLREVKAIRVSAQELARLRLRRGDILFNEGGDRDKLGRGWVWSGEIEDCVHQNHVFRARLQDSKIEPRFVSWYANTVGRDYFVRHGRQTTNLASINKTLLGRLPVPVPSREEQRAILNEIDRRESVAQVLEREMAAAEQRAMTLGAEILRLSLDEAAGAPLGRR